MERELKMSLKSGLTVRKVIELCAMNEIFDSEILLEKERHLCNGKSILGLMSFLLVTKPGDSFKVIIKGHDAEEVVAHWEYFFSNIHEISPLNYWDEQGAQNVQEAMNDTISMWNPNVRSIAKSYFGGRIKGE